MFRNVLVTYASVAEMARQERERRWAKNWGKGFVLNCYCVNEENKSRWLPRPPTLRQGEYVLRAVNPKHSDQPSPTSVEHQTMSNDQFHGWPLASHVSNTATHARSIYTMAQLYGEDWGMSWPETSHRKIFFCTVWVKCQTLDHTPLSVFAFYDLFASIRFAYTVMLKFVI